MENYGTCVRKGDRMIYLYDPISNTKKQSSYDLISGITGQSKKSLMSYKCKGLKIKSINAYIIDECFTRKQRYGLMLKEKPDLEIWKTIRDYENYQISNYGRVRHVLKNNKFKLMMPAVKDDKWLTISLIANKKRVQKCIHKLVSDAFLTIVPGKCIVHKDGNLYNNRDDNFIQLTRKELGLKFGALASGISVIKLDSKTLEELDCYSSMAEAGRENYLHRETIRLCVKGTLKTAGGYKWIVDEEFAKAR